ncbi:3-hydroxyacyl-CoA dehydrogenase family protein [Limobrevibacterium gyesilva]|uniref:L-gulonate 3-dehydrogenase n=1 Tax=Limobrevibacterium gyesilva TaxID=2991712 RepID=A0AA41YNJ1_9PROT|nr:3-hydroxyacyl-CoA dehydrogenase family protein [Limobrevibacterium gyesilva]MCW3475363.1 3-hydroxyacyl-CoA dehydrogenase family protein [Limobrevibacterium gyesilva]
MRVSVFGAGLMGHALALVHALGGHSIRITDNNEQTLERSLGLMQTALATLRDAGEVDASWTSERLAAAVTRCPTVAAALEGAELVVEAIVEKPEAKRALYTEIDALAPLDAIIASNTSYLDIFPLMPERRQARTLIAHWYTPPYLVDLCDIVGSDKTDPAVIETVRKVVAAMGKVPVVMQRFIPGYIANRIQSAITLEVNRLIDEGYATAQDVDAAVIHGLALRIPILGHMAKADFTGLLLTQAALANRMYAPPDVKGHSPTVDRLVADGRTGVMSGKGYFDWGGRSPDELFRERDRKLLALKRALREIGHMEGK